MSVCILKQINVSGPEKGDVNGSIRIQQNLFSIRARLSEKRGSIKVRHERSTCGLCGPTVNPPRRSPTAHFLIRSSDLQPLLAGTQRHASFFLFFLAFSMSEKIILSNLFFTVSTETTNKLSRLTLAASPSQGGWYEEFGLPSQNEYFKQ